MASEPVVVDLFSPEGRAAYEGIYPLVKVPMFKPSDDHMIPESTIIRTWKGTTQGRAPG